MVVSDDYYDNEYCNRLMRNIHWCYNFCDDTLDFYLSDTQITKQDKDWLYPKMIEAIKKVKDSIILVFSPTRLSNLVNYG